MPVYPLPHDDPRALARQLADTRKSLDALRRSAPSTVTDPTPPAIDMEPGSLTRRLLEVAP